MIRSVLALAALGSLALVHASLRGAAEEERPRARILAKMTPEELNALRDLPARHCDGDCLRAEKKYDSPRMYGNVEMKKAQWAKERELGLIGGYPSLTNMPCVAGVSATQFSCSAMDLSSFIPLEDLGSAGEGNDVWGWVDSSGREYAIMGCTDGTSFVDVTVPNAPAVLGFLPTSTVPSNWRDIKVFKDFAYIGSEAPGHGIQVFNLSELPALAADPPASPVTLEQTALYREVGSSHNVVINEATGFLYIVGSKTCAGGLHIVDINDPANPTYSACYSEDGYTHDAECVVYTGPDKDYVGSEICFNYNEDTLTIVDVSDKDNLMLLARQGYQYSAYTHQGWLNAAQTHLIMNDELDEERQPALDGYTRSLIWDVSQLNAPAFVAQFDSTEQSIDHNLYTLVKPDGTELAYESNYCAGIRVLDITDVTAPTQVAFFDVEPNCDTVQFSGTWSNYPYLPSGNVLVSSIERGLYVLQLNMY